MQRAASLFPLRTATAPSSGGGGAPPLQQQQLSLLRRLSVIWVTHFTQGMLTTLPYVVAAYMVRDWLEGSGDAHNEQRVGRLVGVLGASYSFAQLLTSYALGRLSDRIGRRPLLLLGNLVCAASIAVFGAAGSYGQAFAARFLGGMLNAVIGLEKSIIGEALDRSEQPAAMGLFSMVWGVGSLVGPLLGGALAAPCGRPGGAGAGGGPLCRGALGTLLRARPYFLPCFVAALPAVLAAVLTVTSLEETLPSLRRSAGGGGGGGEYGAVGTADDDDGGGARKAAGGSGDLELTEVSLGAVGDESGDDGLAGAWAIGADGRGGRGGGGRGGGASTPPAARAAAAKAAGAGLALGGAPPAAPWWRQRNVQRTLAGYGLIAGVYSLLDEMVPLYASAPAARGGLGMSTAALAAPLSFGGAVLIAWALAGFPWLCRRVGPVRACRIGILQTVPMAALIPAASLPFLPAAPTLFAAMAAKSVAGTNAFTAAVSLVNLAAPEGTLGSVNGVGQTVAAAVRAAGPLLGGLMWGASAALPGGGAWHQFLPFAATAAAAGASYFVYAGVDLQPVALPL